MVCRLYSTLHRRKTDDFCPTYTKNILERNLWIICMKHLYKVLTAVLRQTEPLSFETSSDCTLCQLQDINTYIFELPERDKLDNVSGDRLPHRRPQHAIVSIQQLHGLEVRWPHPNDDDWQRQPRRPNNSVPGLIEVCDLTVSEDEEDVVLLQIDRSESQCECVFSENFSCVFLCVCVCVCVCPHRGSVGLRSGRGDGSNVSYDGREVCGSRESQLRQNLPVGLNDPLNTWERQKGRRLEKIKNNILYVLNS